MISDFFTNFAAFLIDKAQNFKDRAIKINFLNQMCMNKNLFSGLAALLLCSAFTSCSHDVEFDSQAVEDNIKSTYEQAFMARFGTPASDQDWGFGSSASARTRADMSAPAPTYVGPTFNNVMTTAATNTGNAFRNNQVTYGQIEFLKDYQSWDNSGWSDVFYQINAKPVASTYSDDKLAELRTAIEAKIPEGHNNLATATEAGYSLTTKGGPVTLTPIYHDSSSGDLISYYYYPAGAKPSIAQIKSMKKYTVGYISDPNICRNNTKDFHHVTYSLVYYDEATGKASYEFPANYVINFIISNVDLKNSHDIAIFDKVERGQVKTKNIHNYPEYYGDGELNATIHSSGMSQWNLPACNGAITDNNTPHAAVFSIGENNYVGFEDWKDFDYNDVIFEVKGTGGGIIIPPVDEWEELRVIAEDLTVSQSTDFDFNDVVFDVRRYTQTTENHTKNDVELILRAAGGTLPLYVSGQEVHELFGVPVNVMVNTNAQSKGLSGADKQPVTIKLTSSDYTGSTIGEIANSIDVYVIKNGLPCHLFAPVGEIASKIGVKCDFIWCDERQDIDNKYSLVGVPSLFKNWVQGIYPADDWYQFAYDMILQYPVK